MLINRKHNRKYTTKIILNGKDKIGNKAIMMSILITSIQHCTGGPSQQDKKREKN